MSEIKSGAPAFPGPRMVDPAQNGMTLQQYYSAKALQGFCANPSVFAAAPRCGWDLVNCSYDQLAHMCNELADALIRSQEAS